MGDDVFYDPNTKRIESRKTKSKGEVEDAASRSRLTTIAGTGLGAKGKAGKTPMPKQQDGESPAAYAARLREWRESDPDAIARRKALQ